MAFPTDKPDLSTTRATAGTEKLSSPDHLVHHETEDAQTEGIMGKVGVTVSSPAPGTFLHSETFDNSSWNPRPWLKNSYALRAKDTGGDIRDLVQIDPSDKFRLGFPGCSFALPGEAPVRSKIIHLTRDLGAAAGDVVTDGIGFKPKALFLMNHSGLANIGFSIGFGDQDGDEGCVYQSWDSKWQASTSRILQIQVAAADYQFATLKSMDADGFTLTWAKGGNPAGVKTIIGLAIG